MAKPKLKTPSLRESSKDSLEFVESHDLNNPAPSFTKDFTQDSASFWDSILTLASREILESLAIPPEQYSKICGIDEAGRGCVAGSLFICGVVLENPPQSLLSRLRDSKTLSQKMRDSLAEEIKQHAQFHLVKKSAQEIDTQGLSACLRDSLLEILASLSAAFYCFDGSCNFGIQTIKTLIKGDSKLHAISAASILAKSAKDSEMQSLHTQFPQYDFAHNKGYCTKGHLKAIAVNGFCAVHRKTYHLKSLSKSLTLFESKMPKDP